MWSNAGNITDVSRQDETVDAMTCLRGDVQLFSFVKLSRLCDDNPSALGFFRSFLRSLSHALDIPTRFCGVLSGLSPRLEGTGTLFVRISSTTIHMR